jgi:hypothetical protein
MGSIPDPTIDEDISPEEMGSKLSSFLEYVEARFAAEDPSTDICVMLTTFNTKTFANYCISKPRQHQIQASTTSSARIWTSS